jgi:predicted cobalt transporter CbtA
MKHPDPKLHRNISFVKSALRILGGALLCVGQLFAAGALIILAEVLGIAEELV